MSLTFEELSKANAQRSPIAFPQAEEWDLRDWQLALFGEVGEFFNALKKYKRDNRKQSLRDAAIELADIVIYCDHLCRKIGHKLEDVIIYKFNLVSLERGVDIIIRKKPETSSNSDQVDYKKLLIAYVNHIVKQESITFLGSADGNPDLSNKELSALFRLVANECNVTDYDKFNANPDKDVEDYNVQMDSLTRANLIKEAEKLEAKGEECQTS